MKLGARKRRARVGGRAEAKADDPFGAEEEDEDDNADPTHQVTPGKAAKDARKAMNARLQAVNELNASKATNNDAVANAEELDAALDAARRQADAAQHEEKKSRYIDSLLQTAKQREIQHERAREKLIRKNIEDESTELGAPTEVFVTSAYKDKLRERKLWEEEEARRDAEAEKQQTGNFGAFNRLLL
ncbi:Nuclear speckle splicing regulatory protein 1 [Hondaea fermentalgiana]|uniref:Nuclear speckle splicing regulatory protein 1 n=1 Tax=Hondaea fermentalgiana TaxID=2315210 RepID=A0A2R5GI07_9STRA|nr:Nuclear speckle splicing regulatory protein 1 [Hondaea fermentalgiana]|eukprot:GBG29358.1 Nuclear speckle splicing regulatory protein 1 [Hondaea fermentalgiana]